MPANFDKSAIESIVEPVCRAHGVELVDVQWGTEHGGAVLRVLIDRDLEGVEPGGPGSGPTLADCQNVSRDLSTALDVHEKVVPTGRYRLEVSSPGLDRPLVKKRDFERFAGKEVKIHSRVPLPGTADRRSVQGVLVGLDGNGVRITEGSTSWEISLDDITKAHVVYRFPR